jgi:cyclopropane fatty-acyl-phospholipid synthase-like methyltransferase
MRKDRTLDSDYFETLYREKADPWAFATSPYEQEKYARTLAALGETPVESALEVGCSIGVLTEQLARRCRRLVATDVSATALDAARRRCAKRPNVEFRLLQTPMDNLVGRFDLIVLSEVVYYWDTDDLQAFAEKLAEGLAIGGRLLLVHWLGETDYPRSGDEAVTALFSHLPWPVVVDEAFRTSDYRLDLWRRDGHG